ncbi:MAG TPA: MFS transporter [Thermoanaerobaculia bacterium]|nr:MFS transporter [Thermoanaerobaculia bacterium]
MPTQVPVPPSPPAKRPGTLQSLGRAMTSWRTASVTLLSFSSGLPYALVLTAIPDWMRRIGMDIRVVGLITLAQAPWTFKFLWSPFMDRFVPPWLGRRRGWASIAQVALFALTLCLAGVGSHPDTPWVVAALAFAIAFAGASQDIAIDAYAVDVLEPEEQAVAVGARNAVYRSAMYVVGGLGITLAGRYSWPLVNAGLACLYLPALLVTWKAPEPRETIAAPRSLREAAWYPLVGFLSRHRALAILGFLLLYKLADNLAQALQRPFLVDMGYSDFDRGVALATVGLFGSLVGVFAGGVLTEVIGLGRALWIFGFLQTFASLGYVMLAARGGVHRPLMYGAIGFEVLSAGLGSGAFSVLLLRLTQKRFSATQYALFSSLFGLPRLIAGPVCGFAVYAVGWYTFFWFTILAGIPGMIMLARFVPFGAREPVFTLDRPEVLEPLSTAQLVRRGLLGAVVGLVVAAFVAALLPALKMAKDHPGTSLDLATPFAALAHPQGSGWLILLGIVVFATVCGLFTAAVAAARHGQGEPMAA